MTDLTLPVAQIQSLAPSALIELYELFLKDGASFPITPSFRFHANTNELFAPVVWCGNTYSPFPVVVEGYQRSGAGTSPRVTFKIANVRSVMSSLLANGDSTIVGAKVVRRRTFSRYLDAVNFTGGINANADPSVEFAPDIFFVDRKSAETPSVVEFELAPSFDVTGVSLPRRQIIQNTCTWIYRGADGNCGYAGANYATVRDMPTANASEDVCGKRLASCKLRFGATAPLPYGGFPAAGLVRL